MASWRFSVTSPTLLLLFSLLVVEAHTSRKLISNKEQEDQNTSHLLKDGEFEDPSMYMFLNFNDLKLGAKLLAYFNKNELRTLPPLLTRQEADLIPFIKSKLDFLLNHFSISKDSPQGKAMKKTLVRCNYKEIEGEYKFCGTSLESMLDLAKKTIASNADIRVMTTKVIAQNTTSYALHNYTFVETSKELVGIKMLGCHRCENEAIRNKMEIPLQGTNMYGWLRSQDNGDATTRDKHAWWVKVSKQWIISLSYFIYHLPYL